MIPFNYFVTYAEIYGDFTESYRIVIAYTKMEIDIIKYACISSYKSLLVSPGCIYKIINFMFKMVQCSIVDIA